MNGKMLKKFCAALSVAALSVSLLWVGAAADGVRPCGICGDTTFTQTTEFLWVNDSQCAPRYECSNGHRQLRVDENGKFIDVAPHAPESIVTCEARAVCANWGSE